MGRGRYMKAHELYNHVRQDLIGGTRRDTPAWFDVLHRIPPSEILVRSRPVQHNTNVVKSRLPSNTFKPQDMRFFEDGLRKRFFQDHPWELARPRIILEDFGIQNKIDWRRGLGQPGVPLCGESVVQMWMWMMREKGMPRNRAYDKVRKEFYRLRRKEEMEQRVQREEARFYGGVFGPGWLEIGVKLEDKAYAEWLRWATKNLSERRAMREARSSSSVVVQGPEDEGADTNQDASQASPPDSNLSTS